MVHAGLARGGENAQRLASDEATGELSVVVGEAGGEEADGQLPLQALLGLVRRWDLNLSPQTAAPPQRTADWCRPLLGGDSDDDGCEGKGQEGTTAGRLEGGQQAVGGGRTSADEGHWHTRARKRRTRSRRSAEWLVRVRGGRTEGTRGRRGRIGEEGEGLGLAGPAGGRDLTQLLW